MDVLFEVERTDAVGSLCTRPKIALFSKKTLREQSDTKSFRDSGYERSKKGIVSRSNSGIRQRHSRSDYHRGLKLSKQTRCFDAGPNKELSTTRGKVSCLILERAK